MIKRILVGLTVGVFLVGCGYKGALYLPQSKTKSSAPTSRTIIKNHLAR